MLIPPLCEQLIGHCAAHQAVREGEAVGLDACVWHDVHHRPHLATPSQLATSLKKKKDRKTHFYHLPVRASARTSKGCRGRDASSISELQRRRPGQRYSLIVTYDLYIDELSLNPLKTSWNFGPEGLWEYWRSQGYKWGNWKLPYLFHSCEFCKTKPRDTVICILQIHLLSSSLRVHFFSSPYWDQVKQMEVWQDIIVTVGHFGFFALRIQMNQVSMSRLDSESMMLLRHVLSFSVPPPQQHRTQLDTLEKKWNKKPHKAAPVCEPRECGWWLASRGRFAHLSPSYCTACARTLAWWEKCGAITSADQVLLSDCFSFYMHCAWDSSQS